MMTWMRNGAPVDPLRELRRTGIACGPKYLATEDVTARLTALGLTYGEYVAPPVEPEPRLVDRLIAELDGADAETRQRLDGALDPGARG